MNIVEEKIKLFEKEGKFLEDYAIIAIKKNYLKDFMDVLDNVIIIESIDQSIIKIEALRQSVTEMKRLNIIDEKGKFIDQRDFDPHDIRKQSCYRL